MNTREKGNRNERLIKKYFEDLGYSVTKSGGSLGEFDLIGIRSTWKVNLSSYKPECYKPLVLIQVKTNRITAQELQKIVEFDNYPRNITSLLAAVVIDGNRNKKREIKIFDVTIGN